MPLTYLSFNDDLNDRAPLGQGSESVEDLPLRHNWSIWEQGRKCGSKGFEDYANATQKVGVVSSTLEFWNFWDHTPQPSRLLTNQQWVRERKDGLYSVDSLMLFREGIRPEWEDPANEKGGHLQWQLKPSLGAGQIDEYWNNIIMGLIGGSVEPAELITGVRLVDKLRQAKAHQCVRLELWFTHTDDPTAVETLKANVDSCLRMKLDGSVSAMQALPKPTVKEHHQEVPEKKEKVQAEPAQQLEPGAPVAPPWKAKRKDHAEPDVGFVGRTFQ